MFRKNHVPTVLFLAVALLAVGGLQAQSTTGRIIGTVTDQSGQRLPGATVTISSDALIGGPRTASADDGNFQFISLHPGEYTVKIHNDGFVSQERQEVRVALGGASALAAASGSSPVAAACWCGVGTSCPSMETSRASSFFCRGNRTSGR